MDTIRQALQVRCVLCAPGQFLVLRGLILAQRAKAEGK